SQPSAPLSPLGNISPDEYKHRLKCPVSVDRYNRITPLSCLSRFLFVRPAFCFQLSSDPTLR
ncbi:MAG: hypothetical protein N6V49_07450, partial [Serratia symbiotica]|nr:hypothetical protein [Serratia symbiotica]